MAGGNESAQDDPVSYSAWEVVEDAWYVFFPFPPFSFLSFCFVVMGGFFPLFFWKGEGEGEGGGGCFAAPYTNSYIMSYHILWVGELRLLYQVPSPSLPFPPSSDTFVSVAYTPPFPPSSVAALNTAMFSMLSITTI